jgi:UDP:flavonoid glycosyltransferase YjiC (YdhE family)
LAFYIFSGLGAKGHLHPLLPVAAELKKRGHRIALYTSSHYRYLAEKFDFEFLPPVKWRDFDFTYLEKYWPELDMPPGSDRSIKIYFKVFMGTGMDQGNDLLAYVQDLKPDVLVTEPHAVGTQLVATHLKMPWAIIGIAVGVVPLPVLGARGMPIPTRPELYISQGLPRFDTNKNVLPQTHYVGECYWDEGVTSESGFEFPETDRPLILASLGTMFASPDFFKKAGSLLSLCSLKNLRF